ncbi:type I restriction enzyme, S subunit [Rhodoblastus acidophilus]|uniref:Type I restriction enzyme, S subunit n=1 Tax=Rhodoblastus acidophilus TaxID=1074 RepID=A0A212RHD7_RHOAC|nr:restriction endonuclease subunit S [Rhodoblastus acidophilus]PPQ39572.1 restriction endonuclease subunit S [Rhodoblastus acidophilus]RAI24355.1 restriction endonuclease subunit S [Rhodoblastus acidophilus]SNB71671.1 type I restriction enzyme, S subunit [Rhodoblastus acidophilus]
MDATASSDEIKAFALKKGDVIITKDSEDPSDIGIPSLVINDMPGVVCGYHLTIIRSSDFDTARILHRIFESHPTKAHFFIEAPGITRYGLGQDAIGNVPINLPPSEARKSIADRIEREVIRIDALISKKTRFLEILKEKRQTLITHAITKGTDPNTPMKDSDNTWTSKVPQHWKSIKFCRIARVTEGLVDPRNEPYCSMVLIAPNHIESSTGKLINLETALQQNAESGKYICRKGNVIYSKIRPALAKVTIAPCDGLCSADMYPLECTNLATEKWLYYLMLSKPFTAWAILESDRVAMPKINRESLSELQVLLPPKVEQIQIAEYIDAAIPRIDALATKTQRSIELLKERRSAFITAAVTGQIDIRNAL